MRNSYLHLKEIRKQIGEKYICNILKIVWKIQWNIQMIIESILKF